MANNPTLEALSPEQQVEELYSANQRLQADLDEALAINAQIQAMLDAKPAAKQTGAAPTVIGVTAKHEGKTYAFRLAKFNLPGFGNMEAAEAAANPKAMAELVKRKSAVLIEK